MERKILGVTWEGRKTLHWVRSQTKCMDIIETIKKLKWKWAGHLARRTDNRWITLVTVWNSTGK